MVDDRGERGEYMLTPHEVGYGQGGDDVKDINREKRDILFI